jgi:hypothetical protein
MTDILISWIVYAKCIDYRDTWWEQATDMNLDMNKLTMLV